VPTSTRSSPEPIADRDSILRASVDIDPADLNEEFIRAPGHIAYWNQQYADAHREHGVAKIEYDRAWAQLYCQLRADFEGRKPAITVDALKAMVDQDPDIYEKQMQVVVTDAERIRLRGIVDAVVAKKDMLQSLGAKLREEMRGDPVLRNQLTG
jgi:hypothetical protein